VSKSGDISQISKNLPIALSKVEQKMRVQDIRTENRWKKIGLLSRSARSLNAPASGQRPNRPSQPLRLRAKTDFLLFWKLRN
jgi:hypothetical protein